MSSKNLHNFWVRYTSQTFENNSILVPWSRKKIRSDILKKIIPVFFPGVFWVVYNFALTILCFCLPITKRFMTNFHSPPCALRSRSLHFPRFPLFLFTSKIFCIQPPVLVAVLLIFSHLQCARSVLRQGECFLSFWLLFLYLW